MQNRPGRWLVAGLMVIGLLCATCRNPVRPEPPGPDPFKLTPLVAGNCTLRVDLGSKTVSVGAAATSIDIPVTITGADCDWSATTTAAWLAPPTRTQKTTGTVTFSVQSNTGDSRSDVIVVKFTSGTAQIDLTIQQEAAGCQFDVSGDINRAFAVTGGQGSLKIGLKAGPASCIWHAAVDGTFLSIDGPVQGTAPAELKFTVQPNTTSAARNGRLTVEGTSVTVTQEGAPCVATVAPTSVSAPSIGLNTSFRVTALPGCSWTAVSDVPWIAVSPSTGAGTGDVSVSVAANPGSLSRQANLTIANQTIAVAQSGVACSFDVTYPNNLIGISTAAQTFNVDVVTPAGCEWDAVAGDPSWLSFQGSPTRTSSGTIIVNVAANGPQAAYERNSGVTVATRFVQVLQAGSGATCTSAQMSSSTLNVPAAGGSQSMPLGGLTNCIYGPPRTDVSWITITSGIAFGTSPITFTVLPNASGSARSGTVTADHVGNPIPGSGTLTVNQAP